MALISLDFIYKAIDRYNQSEDQRQARNAFADLLRLRASERQTGSADGGRYGLFALNSIAEAFPNDPEWNGRIHRYLKETASDEMDASRRNPEFCGPALRRIIADVENG